MTVADYLAASREAHTRYRTIHAQTQNGDRDAMRQAINEALIARQAAHDLDPAHTDPAWATDEALPWHSRASRGVAHDDLIAFYQQHLARLDEDIATAENKISNAQSSNAVGAKV